MDREHDLSPTVNGRDALSAMSRQVRQQQELVASLIEHALVTGSNMIDLNKKGLKKIPDDLLRLVNLEYLYLEGNNLTCLPEDFFDCLPNLKWLDLRRNYIGALPSTYIGRHKCLRTLLLEGNELKTLPLELGHLSTLNGLNISNNPLEFPPIEIVEQGTKAVIRFLREMITAKSQGRLPSSVTRIDGLTLQEQQTSKSLYESEEEYEDLPPTRNRDSSSGDPHSALRSDLVGPVPSSAPLHRPVSYSELKSEQLDRIRRAGALGTLDSARNNRRKKSSQPLLPSEQQIQKRYEEEKRVAKYKDLKEKQDLVLQRRRDQEVLRQWRGDSKKMQRDKYMQHLEKGKDYSEPAADAPYGFDEERLKVMSNEERIKHDIREAHEKIRRPISPETKQKLEETRAERDRELQKKIHLHTLKMQERRRAPKGTPQDEMEAAKRELEIAEQLQHELAERRKALEYRFTAFTGDDVSYARPQKNKH